METGLNTSKKNFWNSIPSMLILGMTFLLPIIFLPTKFFDFLNAKAGLILLVTVAAIFVWSITKLKDDGVKLPMNWITGAALLVPLTYLISAFFSSNPRVSLLGRDLGYDGAVVFATLFIMMIFISVIFSDKRRAVKMSLSLWASIIIVLVFHIIRLPLLKYFPTWDFFYSSSTNTVGRWYDFGLLAGVGAVVSLAALELFTFIKPVKAFLVSFLGVNLLILMVVNFKALWVILALVSVILFVYFLSIQRIKATQTAEKRIPIVSLITFLIATVFIFGVAQNNNFISRSVSKIFNVSYLEVRPALSTSFDVLKNVVKENSIVGIGAGNYDRAWIKFKPTEFNNTEVWNVDFRYGYSLMISFVTMGGLLNLIAWAIFLIAYLVYGIKAVFRPMADQVSKYVLISSFITSLFLWIMAFLYVPSIVNFGLTLIFTGLFIGSLYREGVISMRSIDTSTNPRMGFAHIFSLVVIMLVSLTGIWHYTTRIIATVNYNQGAVAMNAGDLAKAEQKISSAASLYLNDNYLLAYSEIGLAQLQRVINNTDKLSEADQVTAFRNILSQTTGLIGNSINYAKDNYNNYVKMGEVYESLMGLGNKEAYAEAKTMYEKARELNAKNPAIVLALARLEVANEKNDAARALIGEAIKLKGNYTDAIFLLSRIDVAEGNIKQAIVNVEQATVVRPNDPLVFFQLGLLKYENKDYKGAVSVFERALALNNRYDNAAYFLGLSYDKVGRRDEAILLFQALNKLYPENQDIKATLETIVSGKKAAIEDEKLPIKEETEE